MGPAILPLVVQALARPDNFIAMTLYERIQLRSELVPDQVLNSASGPVMRSEQVRSIEAVRVWLATL